MAKAWQKGLEVSEQQIAAYIPTQLDIQIAEALLNGISSVPGFAAYTGLNERRIRQALGDPVAMAWISKNIYSHFQHRAAFIDSALFTRAVAGDVAAIKLWFERMGKLSQDKTIHHHYSGGVNISALSDEDLRGLIREQGKLLATETKIIDAEFEPAGAGAPVCSAVGAEEEVSGGPVPILSGEVAAPQEAAGLSRGGEEVPAPIIPGGEPLGENDGGSS